MSDEDFERDVRIAAHRVAPGRAPDTLHTRVALIPAADRRQVGAWSRFGGGVRLAGSAMVVLALAGAGLLILATRPHDGSVVPGSSGTTRNTASPVNTASPQRSALVTRDLGGLSLVMPADWQVLWPKVWTAPVGPRVFLSNAPISDPCPTEIATGDACQRPLVALPPNGILVTFEGSAVVFPSDVSRGVTAAPVGPTCSALGGERRLAAVFQGFVVTACLRGPDLATNEAVFRDMVASIKQG